MSCLACFWKAHLLLYVQDNNNFYYWDLRSTPWRKFTALRTVQPGSSTPKMSLKYFFYDLHNARKYEGLAFWGQSAQLAFWGQSAQRLCNPFTIMSRMKISASARSPLAGFGKEQKYHRVQQYGSTAYRTESLLLCASCCSPCGGCEGGAWCWTELILYSFCHQLKAWPWGGRGGVLCCTGSFLLCSFPHYLLLQAWPTCGGGGEHGWMGGLFL